MIWINYLKNPVILFNIVPQQEISMVTSMTWYASRNFFGEWVPFLHQRTSSSLATTLTVGSSGSRYVVKDLRKTIKIGNNVCVCEEHIDKSYHQAVFELLQCCPWSNLCTFLLSPPTAWKILEFTQPATTHRIFLF